MAADFAAAYAKAGGSIAFHKFDGQPHAFIPRDPASPDSRCALEWITDFIRHHTR
jgi:acetyl esterase/lipase